MQYRKFGKIDFEDKTIVASTFVMIIMMPLTFSITYGIASGFLVYGILTLIKRDYQKFNFGLFLLIAISLIAFIYR